jgi:malonyl-CoA O-methyltransferase
VSLFVTGTDTEVGKTVLAAALLWRYGRELPLLYWKPVGTGGRAESDVEAVRSLAGGIAEVREEGYLFEDPVSPHLAARREGKPIELEWLDRRFFELCQESRGLIVEGAGGVLAPLDELGTPMLELPRRWGLPVLVAARSRLGTINHTCLTLEALRARGLEVLGVVLVGSPDPDNREAVERFGKVEVLGELPVLHPLHAATLKRAASELDPKGKLRKYLSP